MPPPPPPAAGRLGGAPVILLALAVSLPSAVVPAQPLLFLGVGLLLLTFAAGYGTMTRRMPHPAPLYSVVARGLGRSFGLGAAGLALLSYQALQLALYGTVGAAAAPLLAGWFGITPAWWTVALCCWAVVACCGVLRIPVAAWLVAILVLAELAMIICFAAANVRHPAGGDITWTAPSLTDLPRRALGLLLVAGALAFIGFETAAGYSEKRRASVLPIAAIATLTAATAWSTGVAAGPGRITTSAAAELPFDLAADRLAAWTVTLGRATLVTGLLAAMIALHLVITRYLTALGRERILPPALGRRAAASLTQTLAAGSVLGICAYEKIGIGRGVGVAGGLGILVLLPVISLAAMLFLNRHPGDAGVWRRFLAPALSTIGLGVLCYLAARDLPTLLGLPVGQIWVGAAAVGTVVLLGIGYGLVLRRRAPVIYAGVGLGGAAVVVSPMSLPIPKPRDPGAHRPERINHHLSH